MANITWDDETPKESAPTIVWDDEVKKPNITWDEEPPAPAETIDKSAPVIKPDFTMSQSIANAVPDFLANLLPGAPAPPSNDFSGESGVAQTNYMPQSPQPTDGPAVPQTQPLIIAPTPVDISADANNLIDNASANANKIIDNSPTLKLAETAANNAPAALANVASMLPEYLTRLGTEGIKIPAVGLREVGAISPEAAQNFNQSANEISDTVSALSAFFKSKVKNEWENKNITDEDVTQQIVGPTASRPLVPVKTADGKTFNTKYPEAVEKAMTNKFLYDSKRLSPDEFKAKYPDAIPFDQFTEKFKSVIGESELPQTAKEIYLGIPWEGLKTTWGLLSQNPETIKRFMEAPIEGVTDLLMSGLMGTHTAKVIANPLIKSAQTGKLSALVLDDSGRVEPQTPEIKAEAYALAKRQMAGEDISVDRAALKAKNDALSLQKFGYKPSEQPAETPNTQNAIITPPEIKNEQTLGSAPENVATGRETAISPEIKTKPVAVEPTPKIGAFGAGTLQNAYEKLFGKNDYELDRQSTVGDPAVASKANAMFDTVGKKEQSIKQESKNRAESTGAMIRREFVDVFTPIYDRVVGAGKLVGKASEHLQKHLEDIFYLPSYAQGYMNEVSKNVIDPLKIDGLSYADLRNTATMKRIVGERSNIKNPFTIKEAQSFLDSVPPDKMAVLEKSLQNWFETRKKFVIDELERKGGQAGDLADFAANNPDYTTFMVGDYYGAGPGSIEYGPTGSIKVQQGTSKAIDDPIAMTMKKDLSLLAANKINYAKMQTVDAMRSFAKSDIQPAEVDKQYVKEYDTASGNKISINFKTYKDAAPGSNLELITFRENGETQGYYVPKEVTWAFREASGQNGQLGSALRFWNQGTQIFRAAWIEYNPIWQLTSNLPRDIMTALIQMPGFKNKLRLGVEQAKLLPQVVASYTPFVNDISKSLFGKDLHDTQFEKDIASNNAKGALLSSKESRYAGEAGIPVAERLIQTYVEDARGGGGIIGHVGEEIKDFGHAIENINKVAAKRVLDKLPEYSEAEKVNMIRRLGSPAFAVRGGGTGKIVANNILMFLNAAKEGYRADWYFYKKDKLGFLTAAAVPFAMAAATALAENGAFGKDTKKDYSKMKKWDKENYIAFPLFTKDNGEIEYFTIPMPQSLKPFIKVMRSAVSQKPDVASRMFAGIMNELPSLNPMMGVVGMAVDYPGETPPQNTMTGKPIMSQTQWDSGGKIKAEAMAKNLWNNYLFGSIYRMNVDANSPNAVRNTPLETAVKALFGKFIRSGAEAPEADSNLKQKDAQSVELSRELASRIFEAKQTGEDITAIKKEFIDRAKAEGLRINGGTVSRNLREFQAQKAGKSNMEKENLRKALKYAKTKQERADILKKFKEFNK